MAFGIEQLFRSAAGADWMSQSGGLSASEFTAALKERAGADLNFVKGELQGLGKELGLSGHDSKAIFDFLEKNGHVSVDALRDKLLKSAGADKAFNLDEFKGGVNGLVGQATDHHNGAHKADGLNFRQDAGADKKIDKAEFQAFAEQAGIHDQAVIDKAFDKLAGADGKIDRNEAKDGLGNTKLSKSDLAKKINELGGEDKKDINFNKAAGADKAMNEDEFAALAKQAGIQDEDQIKKVFDQIAGADGKISKDEFKAAFGDSKVSADDFKQKFDKLAQGDGCDQADQSQQPDSSQAPDQSQDPYQSQDPQGSSGCSKPEHSCGSGEGSSTHSKDHWSVEQKNGEATIKLGKDYTVNVKEDGSKISVTNNCTGQTTEISGDPHFRGKNNFDFKDGMTLKLDNGAKLTIGTTPAGNGTTLATSLTITQGDHAIQVSGIAQGNTDGALQVQQSFDGRSVDRHTADGAATLLETPGGWFYHGHLATQQDINQAEAAYH